VNERVERMIRACPAQYLWGYNRYKHPAGRPCPRGTVGAAGLSAAWHGFVRGSQLGKGLLWTLHFLPIPWLSAMGAGSARSSTASGAGA
jgi:lauroyl/myristoyl acyltransferase